MSIRIALAGNPNSGKTTLFNKLTGSAQFVGNWPGVTVEKKEGKLIVDKQVILTDLPGIYSLSPYTLEEVVARNYLIEEQPDAILNIVDATNTSAASPPRTASSSPRGSSAPTRRIAPSSRTARRASPPAGPPACASSPSACRTTRRRISPRRT